MKSLLSNKCEYALRAVFELCRRNSSDPVSVHELARSQDIPERFLEVILADFRHSGFISSKRGSDGGYYLNGDPKEIRVADVVEHFQPQLLNGPDKQSKPVKPGDAVFMHFWEKVSVSVRTIFEQTTYSDLVVQEERMRCSYVPDYAI